MKLNQRKKTILFIIAIALLLTISFFEWSLWSWIGLGGIICMSIGWYLKK
ncbi:MAG: hypothetical protein WC099_01005 [Candidatus Paceibacterota bacterium]